MPTGAGNGDAYRRSRCRPPCNIHHAVSNERHSPVCPRAESSQRNQTIHVTAMAGLRSETTSQPTTPYQGRRRELPEEFGLYEGPFGRHRQSCSVVPGRYGWTINQRDTPRQRVSVGSVWSRSRLSGSPDWTEPRTRAQATVERVTRVEGHGQRAGNTRAGAWRPHAGHVIDKMASSAWCEIMGPSDI